MRMGQRSVHRDLRRVGWWMWAATVLLVACGPRDEFVGGEEPATVAAEVSVAQLDDATTLATTAPEPTTPVTTAPASSEPSPVSTAETPTTPAAPTPPVNDGELHAEPVPSPDEPNFCSRLLIAEAFQRYDPAASLGWTDNGCMSDEFFGVGEIPGVDQAGIGRVLGGIEGAERSFGFVARLDGVWTVLEVVPDDDDFRGCAGLTVPLAKRVCTSSLSFKDYETPQT